MTISQLWDALSRLAITKRMSWWLGVIAVYCLVIAFVERSGKVDLFELSAEAGLIDGIILGLLMSFRNRAAYERWWEGRRLWGQLVNDSRNFAWKLAALLPKEALSRARMNELIAGFA